MIDAKTVIVFALVGIIGFGTAGCDDKKAQVEIQKHRTVADSELEKAMQLGVPEWVPNQYKDIQTKYDTAIKYATEKQYNKAKNEMDQFFKLLEISTKDTLAAQKKAQEIAEQQSVTNQATYSKERQQMLSDIQTLQNVISAQKEHLDQQTSTQTVPQAPKVTKKAPQTSSISQEYTVQEGDTLRKISGRPEIYNDPSKWNIIWQKNRDKLKSTRDIYPGQVLIIPVDHS